MRTTLTTFLALLAFTTTTVLAAPAPQLPPAAWDLGPKCHENTEIRCSRELVACMESGVPFEVCKCQVARDEMVSA